jgi:hypothetical protein
MALRVIRSLAFNLQPLFFPSNPGNRLYDEALCNGDTCLSQESSRRGCEVGRTEIRQRPWEVTVKYHFRSTEVFEKSRLQVILLFN